MSDDLISRKALFNELFVRNGKVCPNHDIDNFPIRFNVKDIKHTIRNAPTAYDVDKVVEEIREYADNVAELGGNFLPQVVIKIVKSGGVSND